MNVFKVKQMAKGYIQYDSYVKYIYGVITFI